MSHADELLADLEELDGNEVKQKEGEDESVVDESDSGQKPNGLAKQHRDFQSFQDLWQKLSPILEAVERSKLIIRTSVDGNVEDDPEYQLIVQANAYSVEIDEEIIQVDSWIRTQYSHRFPELDKLVKNPLDYAKVVSLVGNDAAPASLRLKKLTGVVSKDTEMVILISASQSDGVKLDPSILEMVFNACQNVLDLDSAKKRIIDFVQMRMNVFAPNVSEIVGSRCTAQLIGVAGGIRHLAGYVSCNLPALGSKKSIQSGMSTGVGIRQQGFIYYCDLVQRTPPDLRKKVMRIMSAKVILAARMDAVHASLEGENGKEWRRYCEKQMDRLIEPAPNTVTKALPVPDEVRSKRRGGRRARKEKEKWAMTELRKAQNRMAFGTPEQSVDAYDESMGLGMIGQETGKIRGFTTDARTKAKLSKRNLGWEAPISTNAANSFENSLTFNPSQGMQLVDPGAKAGNAIKRKADEDRWFSSASFMTAPKKLKGSDMELDTK